MIQELFKRIHISLTNIFRSLRLVWESSRSLTIISLILMVLQGIMPIIVLYLTGTMIDAITRTINGAGGSSQDVLRLIALVGFFTFLGVIFGTLNGIVSEGQSQAVADHIMSAIHAKSILIDLEYYENSKYYNRLHRAQQDAPYRPPLIVSNLVQSVRDIITLIGISGLLLALNHWSLIILLVSSLPLVVVRIKFTTILIGWKRLSAQTERRVLYFSSLLTSEIAAKEIRLFNIGHVFANRYDALRRKLRTEELRIITRRGLYDMGVQAFAIAALFGAFGLISLDALTGTLTIGMIVIAFQAFQRAQATVQSILNSLTTLYDNNVFLTDYYEFLALEPRIIQPKAPVPIPYPLKQGICFENVSFHYANSTVNVLEAVNFTVQPGEVIALVGENGAGKTTLIKLLCRLYDPTEGRITLDGIDLRDFDLLELRQTITVLFQDYNHYQLSAEENIWLGNVEEPLSPDHVAEVARESGAHEVIEALPFGYQTQLGNMFGGQELSIGQWQKVALARTFMRDTQMVVLDEPTSSLDVIAEHEVFERFQEIVSGRSAIIISHRLSTVRMAHRIYVLDHRHIAEEGTHDELIARDGLYAHMFQIQSKYYA